MIRAAAIAAMTLFFGTLEGFAKSDESLVTELSSQTVSIQSNFTGTEIVIFGQAQEIQYRPDTDLDYDLVIVVEGPPQDITTRRKGRLLGVWVNREAETFSNVPSFYAVASTADISEIAGRALLDEHAIGLNHINLAVSGESNVSLSDRDDFRRAFVRLRQDMGLYSERETSITFLTETMFRTNIPLPANIPVGDYVVKSFLFHEGDLIANTNDHLRVAKTGFEQITFELAREHSFVYGVLAVILAIFTGWLAGVIFRKD
ncbi:TIGR02186 family protein [Labrenzia sp. R4_1]|uniref:TIGR02186 family protein n=1 Tax=Labrenzia sp. R4_1 TaxID=2821106 RepID=UPI000ACCA63D|nr:TIGR02186 family protein [Labrenzia sp. R4_1]MBO9424069.1 TIGR02186 family protein [Labrenzia sp. R4_1]